MATMTSSHLDAGGVYTLTTKLLRQFRTVPRSEEVATWLVSRQGPLGDLARQWFQVMREVHDDVREVMHDGHASACVADAPFAYVAVFTAHVNVGFYRGASLPDPAGLLAGTGKTMRHVRLTPTAPVDAAALTTLIHAAYADMKACVR